jgi:hypothetical protein
VGRTSLPATGRREDESQESTLPIEPDRFIELVVGDRAADDERLRSSWSTSA